MSNEDDERPESTADVRYVDVSGQSFFRRMSEVGSATFSHPFSTTVFTERVPPYVTPSWASRDVILDKTKEEEQPEPAKPEDKPPAQQSTQPQAVAVRSAAGGAYRAAVLATTVVVVLALLIGTFMSVVFPDLTDDQRWFVRRC